MPYNKPLTFQRTLQKRKIRKQSYPSWTGTSLSHLEEAAFCSYYIPFQQCFLIYSSKSFNNSGSFCKILLKFIIVKILSASVQRWHMKTSCLLHLSPFTFSYLVVVSEGFAMPKGNTKHWDLSTNKTSWIWHNLQIQIPGDEPII